MKDFNHQLLNTEQEIVLIKSLLTFPDLVSKSMDNMEPQLIANYLTEIASQFHHYYAKHKVINKDNDLTIARVVLVDVMRQVLYNGLNILGVSTPEKM